MTITHCDRRRAILAAKELARDQSDPTVPPHERLWEIARKLDVDRIEPGAIRTQGFVKRLNNGKFAIYFSDRYPIVRRRYTVAHELAHLVLERYVPHIGPENTIARGGGRFDEIERTVDRIAAELLMPELLVVRTLREACAAEWRARGCIGKRRIVDSLRRRLGVSESALIFRLIEIPQLFALVGRLSASGTGAAARWSVRSMQTSAHCNMRVLDDLDALQGLPRVAGDRTRINGEYAQRYTMRVRTPLGDRLLHCDGWCRRIPLGTAGSNEYWIVGWNWNQQEIPRCDDTVAL